MNNNADCLKIWPKMFPPGIEPGTFCVLDRCDNHYTTETWMKAGSNFCKDFLELSVDLLNNTLSLNLVSVGYNMITTEVT